VQDLAPRRRRVTGLRQRQGGVVQGFGLGHGIEGDQRAPRAHDPRAIAETGGEGRPFLVDGGLERRDIDGEIQGPGRPREVALVLEQARQLELAAIVAVRDRSELLQLAQGLGRLALVLVDRGQVEVRALASRELGEERLRTLEIGDGLRALARMEEGGPRRELGLEVAGVRLGPRFQVHGRPARGRSEDDRLLPGTDGGQGSREALLELREKGLVEVLEGGAEHGLEGLLGAPPVAVGLQQRDHGGKAALGLYPLHDQ